MNNFDTEGVIYDLNLVTGSVTQASSCGKAPAEVEYDSSLAIKG